MNEAPPADGPSIVAAGLTRRFGDFTAVDDVSFEVERGAIFGFLGPNGSGKTTCVRMICGLLPVSAGRAALLGLDVASHPSEIRRLYGYMPQKFSQYEDLTVAENLEFFARVYGMNRRERQERIEELSELLDLAPYLDRRAGQLSGGWKQRVALGAALLHRPRVLFLDEPTAGIDPVARRALWNLLFTLSHQGVTIFVTTHYMDEAERCSDLAYIRNSKLLVRGTPTELKAMPDVTPAGHRWLELACPRPTATLQPLAARPGVRDATVFGDTLHLRVDADFDEDAAREALAELDSARWRFRAVEPSLEDVFVTLTRREQAQEGGRV